MKRPSLFKTPRHQRFNLTPRHYDPIKEELEARTARIKAELEHEQKGLNTSDDLEDFDAAAGIRGAFKQRSNRTKSKSVNGMQLVILALIVFGLAAYWYFGNSGLYVFLLVSSLLLYLKLRRII
jgi:hypothetical protein